MPGVFVDRSQFQQVVTNLILNARDAMSEGGVRSFDVDTTPDVDLCLCVTDTGPGVPAELVTKIFEPFVVTKDEARGTGLGLAMARSFAERHRGFLALKSARGKGACFTLCLPAHEFPALIPHPAIRKPDRVRVRPCRSRRTTLGFAPSP